MIPPPLVFHRDGERERGKERGKGKKEVITMVTEREIKWGKGSIRERNCVGKRERQVYSILRKKRWSNKERKS